MATPVYWTMDKGALTKRDAICKKDPTNCPRCMKPFVSLQDAQEHLDFGSCTALRTLDEIRADKRSESERRADVNDRIARGIATPSAILSSALNLPTGQRCISQFVVFYKPSKPVTAPHGGKSHAAAVDLTESVIVSVVGPKTKL